MNYQYIIYGIFGAILFPLIYHLSLKQNTKLCALLPALPVLGITGLILTNINENKKKNILTKNYLENIIIFILLSLIIYIIIYVFYGITNNIVISILISLTVGSILCWCIL